MFHQNGNSDPSYIKPIIQIHVGGNPTYVPLEGRLKYRIDWSIKSLEKGSI